jgi:hypothetical protein
MLVRAVLLFLIVIAALAFFGRLRLPGPRKPQGRLNARKCPKCGTYRIGKGPCSCGYEG